jgi:hypothetical protein
VAVARAFLTGQYELATTIKTQVSAKTITLDPKSHRLYLSAATPEAVPAAKPATKDGRRRYVLGSWVNRPRAGARPSTRRCRKPASKWPAFVLTTG